MAARSVDVGVIGGGVAGLAAAIEAAERGARVTVLESATSAGGASAMGNAGCCIVGSPEQRAAGVDDTIELALSDWAAWGGRSADLEWAQAYLEASRADVHDWLAGLGISWGNPVRQEGNSVARWHLPLQLGSGIIERLLGRCHELGVDVAVNARVTGLVTAGGVVSGVRVGDEEFGARAIVVATGGFVNNPDRLEAVSARLRALPRYLLGGAPTALGDGHRLLESVNATFAHLDNVWVYPNGTPDPDDADGRRGVGVRGVVTELWFNTDGRRFHDESLFGGRTGTDALLAQPGQTAWSVFDQREVPRLLLIDNLRYGGPGAPVPAAVAEFWNRSEHAVRAPDATALAAATGMPAGPLAQGIAAFNAAVASGRERDPLTGRALAGLSEVGPGGLAALRYFPMAQKNFGGVRTNLAGRVIGAGGRAIDGLFAAGEVAGMAGGSINGAAGLEGTMFGPCLYSGRVAGRAATA